MKQIKFRSRTERVLRTTQRSNVCLAVKDGTRSGFSNYRNPSSVWNSGGIRPECDGTRSGFSNYRNPSSVRNTGGIRPECAT